MKKNMLTATLSIVLTLCFSYGANAQQKPSERSLALEIQKIKAKQAARDVMMQQSTAQTTIERPSSSGRVSINPVVPVARRPFSKP